MNPKTSAAKLDESLGIDGSGTGSGVGRLTEAYRLASRSWWTGREASPERRG